VVECLCSMYEILGLIPSTKTEGEYGLIPHLLPEILLIISGIQNQMGLFLG
jgi:hypothetical protein